MTRFFALMAVFAMTCHASAQQAIFLGQGSMVGDISDERALIQTRLTATDGLDESGDVPGATGWVHIEYGTAASLEDAMATEPKRANADNDFIVRFAIKGLSPGTEYFYRIRYGSDAEANSTGPINRFRTLPGEDSGASVRFVMASCMNYCKFMYGKPAKPSGPITATDEDKRLGYPALAAITEIDPDFFIGTGDIVYYDNPMRDAKTIDEMRKCWHEQFRFPRMITMLSRTAAFWSKDDHDFRFDDSDLRSKRAPTPQLGINVFREQMPMLGQGDLTSPTYRTVRVNDHLQLWFTEGRDHRSPNKMDDGPEKTLWGMEQRQWLMDTLAASDATWKIIVTPTPMIGPDDKRKTDNHANLGGFQHEANAFFDWLTESKIDRVMTFCGDRHWQYHSIHRSGVEEFACGALNDENSRMGVNPGHPKGTDPDAHVVQPFTSPKPSGGFLSVVAGETLRVQFHDDAGDILHSIVKTSDGT